MAIKPAHLEKLSIATATYPLSGMRTLLVDHERKSLQFNKKLLLSLGCTQIYYASDGKTALDILRDNVIDSVITDWELPEMSGLQLTQHLRRSPESTNRMIPIVMLTDRKSEGDVIRARDQGVTEYVIKPYPAKSLLERIMAIVESPRNFIVSPNFVGPDRRRRPPLPGITRTANGRAFINRKPPTIIRENGLADSMEAGGSYLILPTYELKQKIGLKISPEVVARNQLFAQLGVWDEAQMRFIQNALAEISKMETALHMLSVKPEEEAVQIIRESSKQIALTVSEFGYSRAGEVARLLDNFCTQFYTLGDPSHFVILEKHIQTLSVIFNKQIRGDDDRVGTELLIDLGKLIRKYL